jgi:hypothetical protein
MKPGKHSLPSVLTDGRRGIDWIPGQSRNDKGPRSKFALDPRIKKLFIENKKNADGNEEESTCNPRRKKRW